MHFRSQVTHLLVKNVFLDLCVCAENKFPQKMTSIFSNQTNERMRLKDYAIVCESIV